MRSVKEVAESLAVLLETDAPEYGRHRAQQGERREPVAMITKECLNQVSGVGPMRSHRSIWLRNGIRTAAPAMGDLETPTELIEMAISGISSDDDWKPLDLGSLQRWKSAMEATFEVATMGRAPRIA